MKEIALFGSGKIGRAAKRWLEKDGRRVKYFIDNDSGKWGSTISEARVISLKDFLPLSDNYDLMLSCGFKSREPIHKQLKEAGITDYQVFDERNLSDIGYRETIVSYAHESDKEDVILYHVLHDTKNIFYIDVGSNDPWTYSVTKLFYDKGACGINIDPNYRLMDITKKERPRDINLCVGVSEHAGHCKLYYQGGYLGGISTTVPENVIEADGMTEVIDLLPLHEICRKYVPENKEIMFLKIDVEGAEKNVLESMDFTKYRPWIVLVESTLPGTDIPNYDQWESILLGQGYHFVYEYGVNRYYVSDEKSFLDGRFVSWDEIMDLYRIFHASPIVDWE